MRMITENVRYGLRRLRRSPGFATTALLTLALGIGATTAIFTLIQQVMLKSIPVRHPEQLYKIGKEIECCVDGGLQDDWRIFSYDLYRTLAKQVPHTEGMAAVEAGQITLAARREGEREAQPLAVRFVSGNYFDVLGVDRYAGRLLQPDDDREGAPPVAVLSYTIWRAKFHSDPGLIGKTILLTDKPVTVVGIAAAAFLGDRNMGDPAGVWIPLAKEPQFNMRQLYKQPTSHWLDILVRVPDASQVPAVENAARLALVQWLKANRDPESQDTVAQIEKQTTELAPAASGINELRDQYEKNLKLLQMITGFVLLIVCANMANLMLVRGVARRQELSVRSALGASRGRLIREMLVESVLLSVIGGLLALLVAYGGAKTMLTLVSRNVQVMPVSASPSLPVLGFALLVSVVTGVLFGIAPAWIASRANPAEALRGANRTTGDASGLQRGLVVLQAALSVALLSSAGLMMASLSKLQQQNFHFDPHGRLIAFVDLQAAGYKYEQLDGLYRQMDQAFAAVPGLHEMAYATYGPMAFNNWGSGVAIDGGDPNARFSASYDAVSPHYFDAVGTSVLKGRGIAESDTAASTLVAVVNQRFVDAFLKGKDPLGARFATDRRLPNHFQIVGVVDDSKYGSPSRAARAMYFTPMAQYTDYSQLSASPSLIQQAVKAEQYRHFANNIVVRYEGDSAAAAASVRRVLQQINPQIPIMNLRTYDEQVAINFTQQRLVVRLTAIFGGLALLLAAIGLYGVTSYGVARRVQEIGVRMALGADRADVVRMVLRGAAIEVGLGLALGVPIAIGVGRMLQSQLYEVKPLHVASLAAASVAMILCALVASAVPARRAASVDPMRALRVE